MERLLNDGQRCRSPVLSHPQCDIQTNADFARLNLFSIEVKVKYQVGQINKVQEFRFTKPEDIGKFDTFIENNVRKYKYLYQALQL